MRADERGDEDPLGRAPLLHMELILVARSGERRRNWPGTCAPAANAVSEMVAGI